MATDRDAFEAWIKKDCGDLRTFGSGKSMHYLNSAVNNAWTGWQARAALASEPAAAIDPDNCAQEVYEHGASVGLFDIPKETANAICAGISTATGARVDWHYFGGRVHIKALPAAEQPAPQAGAAESYANLWNALQAIDTAAVSLPGFEVRHEGGIEAVTKNIVEAIQRVAAHPTEQPSQDAERLDWVIRQGEEFRCFVITDAPGDGEYAVWGDGMDAHGKGKTAREAIDAARAAQAQGEQKCWSCGASVSAEERTAADGNCPRCRAELDDAAQGESTGGTPHG